MLSLLRRLGKSLPIAPNFLTTHSHLRDAGFYLHPPTFLPLLTLIFLPSLPLLPSLETSDKQASSSLPKSLTLPAIVVTELANGGGGGEAAADDEPNEVVLARSTMAMRRRERRSGLGDA